MVSKAEIGAALASLDETSLHRLCHICDRGRHGYRQSPHGQQFRSRHAGSEGEFHELRKYHPGDDTRRIDWRSSLRHQQLNVREYQDQKNETLFLCLDRSASMGLDTAKWLMTIQVCAALSFVLLRRGYRVGLISFSDAIDQQYPACFANRHYARLHAALKETIPVCQGKDSCLNACMPAIPAHASVIIISDFLTANAMVPDMACMTRLKRHAHALQILSDKEGLPLEYVPGPGLLSDIETGNKHLIDSLAPSSATNVKKQLLQHNKHLQQACANLGIPYLSSTTGIPWYTLVYRLLISLETHV